MLMEGPGVVHVDGEVLFVERKTGAALGRRRSGAVGEMRGGAGRHSSGHGNRGASFASCWSRSRLDRSGTEGKGSGFSVIRTPVRWIKASSPHDRQLWIDCTSGLFFSTAQSTMCGTAAHYWMVRQERHVSTCRSPRGIISLSALRKPGVKKVERRETGPQKEENPG